MLAFMSHTTQIVGIHVFDDISYFGWEAIQAHDVPKGRVVNAIKSFLEVYEIYVQRRIPLKRLLHYVPEHKDLVST